MRGLEEAYLFALRYGTLTCIGPPEEIRASANDNLRCLLWISPRARLRMLTRLCEG